MNAMALCASLAFLSSSPSTGYDLEWFSSYGNYIYTTATTYFARR